MTFTYPVNMLSSQATRGTCMLSPHQHPQGKLWIVGGITDLRSDFRPVATQHLGLTATKVGLNVDENGCSSARSLTSSGKATHAEASCVLVYILCITWPIRKGGVVPSQR